MTDTHVTLIIPAAVVTEARAFAATWPGGVGMWTVPLYTDDEVTHYISSGKINPAIAELLIEADAAGIVALMQSQDEESTVTQAEVQALLDAADISIEDGKAAITRLGLGLAGPEELV